MNWQKVYLWNKKIHNYVMWGVIFLGLWMMGSGILMNRQLEGEWIPVAAREMAGVRSWHNEISQWFVIFFGIQMVTGVVMWGVPKLLRRKRDEKAE